MASVYKRTWAGQDGKERVRWVAAYAERRPVAPMARPELRRAVDRLLDGSFQPRVTKRREPRQLELWNDQS
jgi:hypothetical protein